MFLTAIEEYRSEISALDTLTSSSDEEVEKMSPKELREKERIRTEVIKGVEALDFMEDSKLAFPLQTTKSSFVFQA